MLAMHGPHQVAQNSTTYTFPGWSAFTSSPLTHLSTAIAGALSPWWSVTSVFSSGIGAGLIRGVAGIERGGSPLAGGAGLSDWAETEATMTSRAAGARRACIRTPLWLAPSLGLDRLRGPHARA